MTWLFGPKSPIIWTFRALSEISSWHQLTWGIKTKLTFRADISAPDPPRLPSNQPVQTSFAISKTSFFSISRFYPNRPPPPPKKTRPDQPNVPFSCVLSFLLLWIWEESTTVSRTGAKVLGWFLSTGSPADLDQLINGLFVWKFKKVLLTQIPICMAGLIQVGGLRPCWPAGGCL